MAGFLGLVLDCGFSTRIRDVFILRKSFELAFVKFCSLEASIMSSSSLAMLGDENVRFRLEDAGLPVLDSPSFSWITLGLLFSFCVSNVGGTNLSSRVGKVVTVFTGCFTVAGGNGCIGSEAFSAPGLYENRPVLLFKNLLPSFM